MARFYHDDLEMARLIERYSRPAFVQVIVVPPKDKMKTAEETLKAVRKLSENAANRVKDVSA